MKAMIEVYLQPGCLYASKVKQERVPSKLVSLAGWRAATAQLAQGENGKKISQQLLRARSGGGCGGSLGQPGKRRPRFCLCDACRETSRWRVLLSQKAGFSLWGRTHVYKPCQYGGWRGLLGNRYSPADTAHFYYSNCQLWDVLIPRSLRSLCTGINDSPCSHTKGSVSFQGRGSGRRGHGSRKCSWIRVQREPQPSSQQGPYPSLHHIPQGSVVGGKVPG